MSGAPAPRPSRMPRRSDPRPEFGRAFGGVSAAGCRAPVRVPGSGDESTADRRWALARKISPVGRLDVSFSTARHAPKSSISPVTMFNRVLIASLLPAQLVSPRSPPPRQSPSIPRRVARPRWLPRRPRPTWTCRPVLPVVAQGMAQPIPSAAEANQPLHVDRRWNLNLGAYQSGFYMYLADVQNPHSLSFGHFLDQAEPHATLRPSEQAYDDVGTFSMANGFSLVQGSANRSTITVAGTRAQTEKPCASTSATIASAIGRSTRATTLPLLYRARSRARCRTSRKFSPPQPQRPAASWRASRRRRRAVQSSAPAGSSSWFVGVPIVVVGALCMLAVFLADGFACSGSCSGSPPTGQGPTAGPRTGRTLSPMLRFQPQAVSDSHLAAVTNSQKMSLLEFDTFRTSDVQNWLSLPRGLITSNSSPQGRRQRRGHRPGPANRKCCSTSTRSWGSNPLPATSYVVYEYASIEHKLPAVVQRDDRRQGHGHQQLVVVVRRPDQPGQRNEH